MRMTLSRKEMVKKAALDVLKAFIIGVAAAAAAAIILFACGFLFGSFQIVNGFEVVKDGLLLIGATGLFLVAGMLLAKGKKENADEKKEAKNGWRQDVYKRQIMASILHDIQGGENEKNTENVCSITGRRYDCWNICTIRICR